MAQLPGGPLDTTETTRKMPEGQPLPVGVYQLFVVQTKQKETNDKQGVYVEVEFDVAYPQQYQGRKVWDRFNLVNASAEAARIGIEGLSDLGAAAGYPVLEDDEQLVGREVLAELYIEDAKPYTDKKTGEQRTGKPQNKCRKYWPLGTDVEAARKDHKDKQRGTQAPAATAARPASNVAGATTRKWGETARTATPASTAARPPASAPAPQVQQQAAAATAPKADYSQAPWKRKQ